MLLSQLEELFDIPSHAHAVSFQSVSIDTRTIAPGALFVAIQGENFDGHDFIKQAQQQGAVAVISAKAITSSLPIIRVKDTRLALGQLAAYHRQQFNLPVVALTGSNGKTTTKEMIAAIFRAAGSVLATQGNLNNDLGVPLTLLKLTAEHQFAVIELGANHRGEIAYTSQLVKPAVALITNVAAAHTAGFGSIENIAHEKGQIYQAVPHGGTIIVNKDDAFATTWQLENQQRRCLTFAIKNQADFMAHDTQLNNEGYAHFKLTTPAGRCDISLSVPGLHNVANALAAAAAATAIGVSLDNIQQGLSQVPSVNGRLRLIKSLAGGRLIDDTYNANPASVTAAINFLSQFPGKKILVLGDMGELGDNAAHYHFEIGEVAKHSGIDLLYTCGTLSYEATKAFGSGAQHFASHLELINALTPQLTDNVNCLVKGSRSAKMEVVVSYFKLEQD